MNTPIVRGLAVLALLTLAPTAQAITIQTFSTTQNFSGNYAYYQLGGSANWGAAQSAAPLASVVFDLTIAGSFTLLEGNPFRSAASWTPTVALSFAPTGPGISGGAPVQYSVTGTTQFMPADPNRNVTYFQPVTLSFSQQFSFTLTGAALAAYQGNGSVYVGDTSSFWPNPYYGQYSGTVTHTGALTYNTLSAAPENGASVPEGGATGALLLGGLGLCGLVHHGRRIVFSLPSA